jgi:glucose uptake protein GlcU
MCFIGVFVNTKAYDESSIGFNVFDLYEVTLVYVIMAFIAAVAFFVLYVVCTENYGFQLYAVFLPQAFAALLNNPNLTTSNCSTLVRNWATTNQTPGQKLYILNLS